MAEGTPLERVQVVNSGARVQIPPSPLLFENIGCFNFLKKLLTNIDTHVIIYELSRKNDNETNASCEATCAAPSKARR